MIGTALSLGQILADPIRYLAILVEGPHEIEFRGNNLSFVAAFEGLQQLLFGVSKPCGSHVESWEVRVIYYVHGCLTLFRLAEP